MSDCECVETKCPDGIPAWVMTFADLMSLLLAFFVLLFSFSEMDKAIYKELAGSLKDAFGVQREIKAKETPRGINIIAREFSPGRPQNTPVNEVRQMTTDESKLHPVFTDPAVDGQENQSRRIDITDDKSFNAMKETEDGRQSKDGGQSADNVQGANTKLTDDEIKQRERIKVDSKRVSEALDKEINNGLVNMVVTQKRIILSIREKGSFPSGSAQLMAPFKTLPGKISQVFSDFDGTIIVSGHTDNIPINTYRFRSNWELSSSRAVSVIHELVKDKIFKQKKFEIAAYADTQPVDVSNTSAGRAKNRRVEITMDYSKKEEGAQSVKDDVLDKKLKKNDAPENEMQQLHKIQKNIVDNELAPEKGL